MYEELARIAEREFGDIVTGWQLSYRRAAIPLKLRLEVRDGTYNALDHMEILTFPKYFHNGSEDNVLPSTISDEPREACESS